MPTLNHLMASQCKGYLLVIVQTLLKTTRPCPVTSSYQLLQPVLPLAVHPQSARIHQWTKQLVSILDIPYYADADGHSPEYVYGRTQEYVHHSSMSTRQSPLYLHRDCCSIFYQLQGNLPVYILPLHFNPLLTTIALPALVNVLLLPPAKM